jgi:hypothetical protein
VNTYKENPCRQYGHFMVRTIELCALAIRMQDPTECITREGGIRKFPRRSSEAVDGKCLYCQEGGDGGALTNDNGTDGTDDTDGTEGKKGPLHIHTNHTNRTNRTSLTNLFNRAGR